MAFLEILWTRYDGILEKLKKNWIYFILILAIPFLSSFLWWTKLDESFFRGSLEKHHGFIFFAGVILLVLLVQALRTKEKNLLIKASLISGLLVSLFALFEYMGISIFFYGLSGASWGSERSISTLGNPNYVAGYLLILLPLVQTIRKPERYVVASIFIMAILVTKSFIAIFLVVLYGVWILGNSVYPLFWTKQREVKNPGASKTETWILRSSGWRGKIAWFFTFAVACSIIAFGYFLLPPDKLLSLTSRFVLMKETLSIMFQYPFSLLVGFGPDSIIHAYEWARSTVIDAYFPRGSAIDSSHNIVIDILFQYGALPVILAPYFLYKNWANISLPWKEWFLLGVGFLSMNPYVISHAILLVLLTAPNDRKDT